MSSNRIEKFFEDESKEHGEEWVPQTVDDRHEIARRAADLMGSTLLAYGCVPPDHKMLAAHAKMIRTANMLVDLCLLQHTLNGTNFLRAMAVAMGTTINLVFQDIAVVAEFGKGS